MKAARIKKQQNYKFEHFFFVYFELDFSSTQNTVTEK